LGMAWVPASELVLALAWGLELGMAWAPASELVLALAWGLASELQPVLQLERGSEMSWWVQLGLP